MSVTDTERVVTLSHSCWPCDVRAECQRLGLKGEDAWRLLHTAWGHTIRYRVHEDGTATPFEIDGRRIAD